jgi:hypothetical protein
VSGLRFIESAIGVWHRRLAVRAGAGLDPGRQKGVDSRVSFA